MLLLLPLAKEQQAGESVSEGCAFPPLTILGKDLPKSVQLIVCVCFCPSRKSFFYWIKSSLSSN